MNGTPSLNIFRHIPKRKLAIAMEIAEAFTEKGHYLNARDVLAWWDGKFPKGNPLAVNAAVLTIISQDVVDQFHTHNLKHRLINAVRAQLGIDPSNVNQVTAEMCNDTINLEVTLPPELAAWANAQPDPEAAIVAVLEAYVGKPETELRRLGDLVRRSAPLVPTGLEVELPQVVGYAEWSKLDRSMTVRFGKAVKADPASYGLEFVRTTSSRHAVYRKVAV